jgi:Flp pilus assembly protein TadD
MATPFLSSEEYDERAHRLYDDGEYDSALDTLKEGLRLYPHSVELYVGLGYTRIAREEFVWARQAFERALVLDPEHEDGLVGLGETLLRFGQRADALAMFARARESGCADDVDLLLSMGRALYREKLFDEAHDVFSEAVSVHGDSAEAAAALAYTLHRMDDEPGARRQLRRALHIDPEHHEARIYLGHLLYDRGDWAGALREFERVGPDQHWDSLALSRLIELKRALSGLRSDAEELAKWAERLDEIEAGTDAVDELLAEIEAGGGEEEGCRSGEFEFDSSHRVHLPAGGTLTGSWHDIVRQLRDVNGKPGETVAQFMRRRAKEERVRTGVLLPVAHPKEFVIAGARAGYWHIDY